jgi:ParB family chromosome partitioning protein
LEKNNNRMDKLPSRLGRGLSALIPPSTAESVSPGSTPSDATHSSSAEGVQMLSVSAITPNALQPRSHFDEQALEDLAASLKVHGVLQPIMVRPRGGNRFELVAGERRYRAAQIAGLSQIPAVVRSFTDEESLTVALIENIQREDLNPIEAARGYKQLMEDYGLTQAQLGQQIGKKQSTLSNVIGLLKLPAEIQASIAEGRLSIEHGKILLSVDDPSDRHMLWRDFLDLKMSRSDAREHAKAANTLLARPHPAKDLHWRDLEDRLRRAVGSKVEFKPSPSGGGTVTIKCASQDELDGFLEKLNA